MLDRMVGYRISPLLWAKVKRGLSAGRVQSVTLRIIADREEEIAAFIPEEYWTWMPIYDSGRAKTADCQILRYGKRKDNDSFKRRAGYDHEKAGRCKVPGGGSEKRRTYQKAPVPFTTSTLQQEASKVLNFSTQKTMRVAQQLYEGVDVKGSGTVGIITYLRTDSTRISDEADASARAYVEETTEKNTFLQLCRRKRAVKRSRMLMRQSVRRISRGHRLL